jgi:hypothetical protein
LERIAQLEQRVNELEARLNRHSGNSSQPPSQDPPQAPRNLKEQSGRKAGGQVGHPGTQLSRLAKLIGLVNLFPLFYPCDLLIAEVA